MDRKQLKTILHKIWYFIWESNSVWSWIVNIFLAFVIIKFLVYPGLGFALGTSHPIVAVVSSSMEHNGGFDQWWNSRASCDSGICTQSEFYSDFDIAKEQFLTFKFKNGFNKGDIIVLKKAKIENIEIGDVIVFISSRERPRPDPIIHRIIKITKTDSDAIIQTKGDHNSQSIDSCTSDGCLHELDIRESQSIGRAIIKIPYLGWIKIAFVGLLKLVGILR